MTGTLVNGLTSPSCFFSAVSRSRSAFNSSFVSFNTDSSAFTFDSARRFRSRSSGVQNGRTGVSSLRSASAVLLKNANRPKYSRCVSGSYLWVWHWAHAIDVPIHTMNVVFTRSTTATLRNSSSFVPPSLFVIVFRWNAVAVNCSSVGFGRRSPASCSTVNRSNGMFWLNAWMT